MKQSFTLLCVILTFTILVLELSGIDAVRYKCREDEDYSRCGTSCTQICPKDRRVHHCNRNCVRGCACKKPLMRRLSDNNCVRKIDC